MRSRNTYIAGILAAAVALLSGCVNLDTIRTTSNIAFKPLIGHDTRAVESVPFPEDQTFKVWASTNATGQTYIDAEEISHTEQGWFSSKKWPFEDLNFQACWPTDLAVGFTAHNGLQLNDFDCTSGDTDILIAGASSKDMIDGVSTLTFDHILSRIEFRMLHSLSDDMSVRLKKIEMIGFAGKGDYNTKNKNEWSTDANDFSYVVYDAGNTDGIDITSGTAQYIGEEFYVIPQVCTASLEVSYDVRFGTANWIPQTETIESLKTFWEPSKHYTYTVNLRMDRLTHTTGISSWNNLEE